MMMLFVVKVPLPNSRGSSKFAFYGRRSYTLIKCKLFFSFGSIGITLDESYLYFLYILHPFFYEFNSILRENENKIKEKKIKVNEKLKRKRAIYCHSQ